MTDTRSKHGRDEHNRELFDPRPFEPAVGLHRPLTLQEKIARGVQQVLVQNRMDGSVESYDEFNDFDVKDEFEVDEPLSGYELVEEEYIEEPKQPADPAKKKSSPTDKGEPKEPASPAPAPPADDGDE